MVKSKRNKRMCIEKPIFLEIIQMIKEIHANKSNFHTDPEPNNRLLFNKLLLNCLLYYTGLRTNEVLLLTKTNIVTLFTQLKLPVYCSKGDNERIIIFTPQYRDDIIECFKGVWRVDSMDTFFERISEVGLVNKYGGKLLRDAAIKWMDPIFDELEKRHGGSIVGRTGRAWGMHSYRTNYINQVLRAGSLHATAAIIGHKSIETTLIYYRRLQRDTETVHNIIKNAAI